MKNRGIIIRILPHHAKEFKAIWQQMKALDITDDFGETMNEAIYNELQNLQLRWTDAINDAERQSDED
jgi:hypothetical protein